MTTNEILHIEKDRKKTVLIGYRLSLTPAEHKLILILSSDRDSVHPADALAIALGTTAESVAVHISSINKKAQEIAERKLVISLHSKGYKLNPEM